MATMTIRQADQIIGYVAESFQTMKAESWKSTLLYYEFEFDSDEALNHAIKLRIAKEFFLLFGAPYANRNDGRFQAGVNLYASIKRKLVWRRFQPCHREDIHPSRRHTAIESWWRGFKACRRLPKLDPEILAFAEYCKNLEPSYYALNGPHDEYDGWNLSDENNYWESVYRGVGLEYTPGTLRHASLVKWRNSKVKLSSQVSNLVMGIIGALLLVVACRLMWSDRFSARTIADFPWVRTGEEFACGLFVFTYPGCVFLKVAVSAASSLRTASLIINRLREL